VVVMALWAINSAFSRVVKAPTCSDQSRGTAWRVAELIKLSMEGALPMATILGLGSGTPATTIRGDCAAATRYAVGIDTCFGGFADDTANVLLG
jgi:hypothetical protein